MARVARPTPCVSEHLAAMNAPKDVPYARWSTTKVDGVIRVPANVHGVTRYAVDCRLFVGRPATTGEAECPTRSSRRWAGRLRATIRMRSGPEIVTGARLLLAPGPGAMNLTSTVSMSVGVPRLPTNMGVPIVRRRTRCGVHRCRLHERTRDAARRPAVRSRSRLPPTCTRSSTLEYIEPPAPVGCGPELPQRRREVIAALRRYVVPARVTVHERREAGRCRPHPGAGNSPARWCLRSRWRRRR